MSFVQGDRSSAATPIPPDPTAFMEVFKPRQGADGVMGKGMDVITNSFSVSPPKKADLHFFDVSILVRDGSPEQRIRKDENRKLVTKALPQLQQIFKMSRAPLFAYDDEKTLVFVNSRPPVNVKNKTPVEYREAGAQQNDGTRRERIYDLVFTYTKNLMITEADFRPVQNPTQAGARRTIECLQAMNLLMREALSDVTASLKKNPGSIVTSNGDKVFSNIGAEFFRCDQNSWRSIWPGFTAALRQARQGLVLNADLTHSVFFKEDFLHITMCNMLNIPTPRQDLTIQPRDVLNLTQTLRSRLVEFQTPDGASYTNGQLGKFLRPARDQFINQDSNISVMETYASRNIILEFPNFPTVEVQYGGNCYRVPVELCYLQAGQRYNKPLTKQEQAVFIRTVSKGPNERIGNIARFMNISSVRVHPLLQEIGMVIADRFMEISARVLPLPALEYKDARNAAIEVRPNTGAWNMDASVRYNQASELEAYVVLLFPNRSGYACVKQPEAEGFFRQLRTEATRRGMKVADQLGVVEVRADQNRTGEELESIIQKYNPKFVFAIFERGMDRQYSDFKLAMDNVHGIPSQGLLSQTVQKNPRGCVENIMYKVNVKAGGVNNILTERTLDSLRMLFRRFMIMGISLSHGRTKDTDKKPSYAAFVSSIDDSFKNWISEVMVTEANEAVLTDISEKVRILLQAYRDNTGEFPEVLIVYRDGVTRTHETELHKNDILCIRQAFDQLRVKIELVFVVVNKMHRIRFFRMPERNNMCELNYSRDNIPPGLVVDQQVVDPFSDDFYLASHRGMLGTSRPIRYHILVNEDKESTADDVQALTMNLCYIYQRCTMGVSIPAPLYYANLAAARCAVLADSVVRELASEAPRGAPGDRGRGRSGRGGRGGRGRGGSSVPGILDNPDALVRIRRGIAQNKRLSEKRRLSYI